ncbi:MAG: hypothetical protein A2X94_10775 [Bdellovibrionales bacterium GWB1_55_8]|nr:MAG: hypothetical protein A2X94_10775 [Bdellovibrionales bacterium GWB1_55_8]
MKTRNAVSLAITMAVALSSASAFAAGYECKVSASKNERISCEGMMNLSDPDQGVVGSFAWLPCEKRYNSSQIVMIQEQGGYSVILKVWKNENRSIGQAITSFEGEQPRSFVMQYDTNDESVRVECAKQ